MLINREKTIKKLWGKKKIKKKITSYLEEKKWRRRKQSLLLTVSRYKMIELFL